MPIEILKRRLTPERKSLRSLELVLPATSANLGPAFDAAALAFDLFLKIRARTADGIFHYRAAVATPKSAAESKTISS